MHWIKVPLFNVWTGKIVLALFSLIYVKQNWFNEEEKNLRIKQTRVCNETTWYVTCGSDAHRDNDENKFD